VKLTLSYRRYSTLPSSTSGRVTPLQPSHRPHFSPSGDPLSPPCRTQIHSPMEIPAIQEHQEEAPTPRHHPTATAALPTPPSSLVVMLQLLQRQRPTQRLLQPNNHLDCTTSLAILPTLRLQFLYQVRPARQ
jgi:hypothetical protein